METWKPICSPWSRYSASSLGRIRDDKRGRILKISRTTQAGRYTYMKASLVREDGERKLCSVHRLVAMAFVPGNQEHDVNHKDLDKANNKPENLEWVSHRDNVLHGLENVFGWRDKLMHQGRKHSRPVISTAPDGTETMHDAAVDAARMLGHVNKAGNISHACRCGFVRYGMTWRFA